MVLLYFSIMHLAIICLLSIPYFFIIYLSSLSICDHVLLLFFFFFSWRFSPDWYDAYWVFSEVTTLSDHTIVLQMLSKSLLRASAGCALTCSAISLLLELLNPFKVSPSLALHFGPCSRECKLVAVMMAFKACPQPFLWGFISSSLPLALLIPATLDLLLFL